MDTSSPVRTTFRLSPLFRASQNYQQTHDSHSSTLSPLSTPGNTPSKGRSGSKAISGHFTNVHNALFESHDSDTHSKHSDQGVLQHGASRDLPATEPCQTLLENISRLQTALAKETELRAKLQLRLMGAHSTISKLKSGALGELRDEQEQYRSRLATQKKRLAELEVSLLTAQKQLDDKQHQLRTLPGGIAPDDPVIRQLILHPADPYDTHTSSHDTLRPALHSPGSSGGMDIDTPSVSKSPHPAARPRSRHCHLTTSKHMDVPCEPKELWSPSTSDSAPGSPQRAFTADPAADGAHGDGAPPPRVTWFSSAGGSVRLAPTECGHAARVEGSQTPALDTSQTLYRGSSPRRPASDAERESVSSGSEKVSELRARFDRLRGQLLAPSDTPEVADQAAVSPDTAPVSPSSLSFAGSPGLSSTPPQATAGDAWHAVDHGVQHTGPLGRRVKRMLYRGTQPLAEDSDTSSNLAEPLASRPAQPAQPPQFQQQTVTTWTNPLCDGSSPCDLCVPTISKQCLPADAATPAIDHSLLGHLLTQLTAEVTMRATPPRPGQCSHSHHSSGVAAAGGTGLWAAAESSAQTPAHSRGHGDNTQHNTQRTFAENLPTGPSLMDMDCSPTTTMLRCMVSHVTPCARLRDQYQATPATVGPPAPTPFDLQAVFQRGGSSTLAVLDAIQYWAEGSIAQLRAQMMLDVRGPEQLRQLDSQLSTSTTVSDTADTSTNSTTAAAAAAAAGGVAACNGRQPQPPSTTLLPQDAELSFQCSLSLEPADHAGHAADVEQHGTGVHTGAGMCARQAGFSLSTGGRAEWMATTAARQQADNPVCNPGVSVGVQVGQPAVLTLSVGTQAGAAHPTADTAMQAGSGLAGFQSISVQTLCSHIASINRHTQSDASLSTSLAAVHVGTQVQAAMSPALDMSTQTDLPAHTTTCSSTQTSVIEATASQGTVTDISAGLRATASTQCAQPACVSVGTCTVANTDGSHSQGTQTMPAVRMHAATCMTGDPPGTSSTATQAQVHAHTVNVGTCTDAATVADTGSETDTATAGVADAQAQDTADVAAGVGPGDTVPQRGEACDKTQPCESPVSISQQPILSTFSVASCGAQTAAARAAAAPVLPTITVPTTAAATRRVSGNPRVMSPQTATAGCTALGDKTLEPDVPGGVATVACTQVLPAGRSTEHTLNKHGTAAEHTGFPVAPQLSSKVRACNSMGAVSHTTTALTECVPDVASTADQGWDAAASATHAACTRKPAVKALSPQVSRPRPTGYAQQAVQRAGGTRAAQNLLHALNVAHGSSGAASGAAHTPGLQQWARDTLSMYPVPQPAASGSTQSAVAQSEGCEAATALHVGISRAGLPCAVSAQAQPHRQAESSQAESPRQSPSAAPPCQAANTVLRSTQDSSAAYDVHECPQAAQLPPLSAPSGSDTDSVQLEHDPPTGDVKGRQAEPLAQPRRTPSLSEEASLASLVEPGARQAWRDGGNPESEETQPGGASSGVRVSCSCDLAAAVRQVQAQRDWGMGGCARVSRGGEEERGLGGVGKCAVHGNVRRSVGDGEPGVWQPVLSREGSTVAGQLPEMMPAEQSSSALAALQCQGSGHGLEDPGAPLVPVRSASSATQIVGKHTCVWAELAAELAATPVPASVEPKRRRPGCRPGLMVVVPVAGSAQQVLSPGTGRSDHPPTPWGVGTPARSTHCQHHQQQHHVDGVAGVQRVHGRQGSSCAGSRHLHDSYDSSSSSHVRPPSVSSRCSGPAPSLSRVVAVRDSVSGGVASAGSHGIVHPIPHSPPSPQGCLQMFRCGRKWEPY